MRFLPHDDIGFYRLAVAGKTESIGGNPLHRHIPVGGALWGDLGLAETGVVWRAWCVLDKPTPAERGLIGGTAPLYDPGEHRRR